MNKIKLMILVLAVSVGFLSSCKKESEGVSGVTNYPVFTMTGDAFIIHQQGTPYTDPGVIATEGGSQIPVTTGVSGYLFDYSGTEVDGNVSNWYDIIYSATNKDGFEGSATRTVIVANNGDLTTNIEGLYTSTVVRNGSTGAQYTSMEYIMIRKTGANTYELTDAIGGYYEFGRAYGPNYRASGVVITANDIAANNFSFTGPVGVGAFGGNCEVTGMTVDASAKTIVYQSTWDAGYNFEVTLTQVSF